MNRKKERGIIDLGQKYWSERYQNEDIGWDIGDVSTPIKEYVDQLKSYDIKILIPGAGNAYEAEYLWKKGFKNIYVADISDEPLKNLSKRCPDFPQSQLLNQDFFDLNGQFDLILEQTFFCALDPVLRVNYVRKMHNLLKPGGKLIGLLFNIPLYEDHPPFGGNEDIYRPLFSEFFKIEIMEIANNSISPRMGNELFIKLLPLKL